MEGWVKFHRKIEDWEWYTDANTFRVFFHLVMKANHKDKKWQGIEIKRGQVLTSADTVALELKLTRQKVRTAFDKLNGSELTIKTTNRYTLVTVENYDVYQTKEEEVTNESNNKQPTDNQQITTTKNIRIKECEEDINTLAVIRSFLPKEMTKTTAQANKKIPEILKKISKEELIRSIQRYEKSVVSERQNGFNRRFMNESTFWNGRYVDYLDKNTETEKPKRIPTAEELADIIRNGGEW